MIQKLHGSHPNLLRLFGWVFPEPDVLHVVMEKAERGLLRALQEELPLIIRVNIAVDVAEGLKAIHDINYTYEDLKPGNILVRVLAEGTTPKRSLSHVHDTSQARVMAHTRVIKSYKSLVLASQKSSAYNLLGCSH